MHVSFGQFSTMLAEEADVIDGPKARAELRLPDPAPVYASNVYGGAQRANWPVIAVVSLLHVVLLGALIIFDVVPIGPPKRVPTVVEMIELPMDPPPAAAPPPPEQAKLDPVPAQTPVVAPPPVVRLAAVSAPMVAAPQAAPIQPAPVAPQTAAPVAAPAPPAPVKAGDLSTRMIDFKAPRYPIESRKKKEQGTVVLSVLLDTAGKVAQISVARSSGFARLDKAALEAVRKWRWSPTIRNGEPVMVSGSVPIPFILQS